MGFTDDDKYWWVGWIIAIIIVVIVVLFTIPNNLKATEIERSGSGSKNGGYLSETIFTGELENHSLRLSQTSESAGDKYTGNYYFNMDSYFYSVSWKKDKILKQESLYMGIGYGWHVINSELMNIKINVSGLMIDSVFVTSLKSESFIGFGILRIHHSYTYKPEIKEITNIIDYELKTTEHTSIGYKITRDIVDNESNWSYKEYVKWRF